MLRLNIDTNNAAFSDGNRATELARILRHFADRLNDDEVRDDVAYRLADINGNTVGYAVLTPDPFN